MATRRSSFRRSNYRFLPEDLVDPSDVDSSFELDESDIYSSFCRSNLSECLESVAGTRIARRKLGNHAEARDRDSVLSPSSLPVNIPDWSKILREEYQDSAWKRDSLDNDFDENEEEEDGSAVTLPPHEFLARQMAQSTIGSLEGVSRTLKVRELNRIRNAVWARIGFED